MQNHMVKNGNSDMETGVMQGMHAGEKPWEKTHK